MIRRFAASSTNEGHGFTRFAAEKNQDLKSVMLEETPWLRQANDESQRGATSAFSSTPTGSIRNGANTRKLTEMQLPDGSWPWFPAVG